MEFAQIILQYLTSGGAGAVIALLFGVIIVLIMDHRNISKNLDSTIQRVYDTKDSETKSIRVFSLRKSMEGFLNYAFNVVMAYCMAR